MNIEILIVDDKKENIRALSELISSEQVDIYSATNAEEALELVSRHEFGLALLDVQMPITSGLELAKIIRSVKKYKNLPIVFVTAHQEDNLLIYESYQTGAVDLLFKPLDAFAVRSKVKVFVELAKQKKQLELHLKELERLRLESDAANSAKSIFLANMSHEIRTPLAAIMGFSEIILKEQRENKKSDESYFEAVDRNGKLLMKLIDDILDLSKIEANKSELESIKINLLEVFAEIKSTMSFKAITKNISLNFLYNCDLNQVYISDPTRLKQVLLNIIGNAIKFTAKGEVEVLVNLLASPSSEFDDLVVRVKDQGIGLDANQREKLFQPFSQADSSTKKKFGGSGLGLFISRQIAVSMGGDIKLVSSLPGEGSQFEIRVRLKKVLPTDSLAEIEKITNANNSELENGSCFENKTILVVDDSADNLTLMELYLRDSKANLIFADSGVKAIDLVKKYNFDMILMDIQMPIMDGHQATQEIRSLGFAKPILALTAHAIKSEHEKCIQSGCDFVLTKPINQDKLIESLSICFAN